MAHHHDHGSSYPERNLAPGKKWIKGLTQNRLGTFVAGFFSDVNLYSVLFTQRIDDTDHIKMQVWSAPGLTKPSFEEAMKQTFREAKKGESFGPSWTNHWFKVQMKIPADWDKYERVQLEFDPTCEAMVFTTDGTPLQGITGGDGGDRRVEFIIPPKARKAHTLDVVIEVSCNGMFGVPPGDIIKPPEMDRYFQLKSADLVVPNQDAWSLMLDFQTLRELVDNLPGNTILQNKALTAANEIMNVFENRDLASIPKARKVAEQVFGEAWEAKGADIYKEGPEEAQIWGIGHCHIDTAWLWPYHVTQQKVARSWSTQVDLMDRYPEHRFTCSQAQQYKWLEQLYPPLFERVKEKVLAGKFHPVGGSWVENDANMPSGEALSRQFILGQRYFESRFGTRCDTAWLPDSFGLTGALPQLIRLSGMKYFFTQKLSWNNINVFPHSTFNWVGIDGTQVLCHMTPVDTYTAQATVGDVTKGISNNKNIESNSTALLVFGNGDGGGGPLSKMLENLRRIRATGNLSRDIPPVVMGNSVDEFFEFVEKNSDAGSTLPNWHGELYLEFHRGTYTSHGSIKKGNRKSEILLRDVEHVATMASIQRKDKYSYPFERINGNWEKVLLNQFHDVLPGSAIGMVYDDAEKLYSEVRKDGYDLIEEAFGILSPESLPLNSDTLDQLTRASALFGYNTTFFPRVDIVKVPLTGNARALGGSVLQTRKDGAEGYAVLDGSQGGRFAPLAQASAKLSPVSVSTNAADHFILENAAVKMVVQGGRITSLFDVVLGRELVPKGMTGGLIIFDDRPNYWDAWDVEIHHLEKFQQLKFGNVKVVAEGPVRASVQTEVKYENSTILLTISLDAIPATLAEGSRHMFTFDAEVDWHQRHEFLKFEIPLNIHSDVATYEAPFGHVQRPTHKNTTWDMAKFEVCGHKYADLSEYGYGVAILSESKYGFSCRGNVLRISLLRAATAPDAEQDQGKHEFSWAVLPHQGHFLQSDVAVAAYLFNSPVHVRFMPNGDVPAPPPSSPPSVFSVSGAPSVFLETIKRGDGDDSKDTKGRRTIILRAYEALGGHARADLRVHALKVGEAYATNLLEDDADAEKLTLARSSSNESDVSLRLDFHGFEVKTIKLVLDGSTEKQHGKKDSWIDIEKDSL